MKTKSEFKLAELAEKVGTSPRTVRYYVQRGLVPKPDFRGPDTVYGEEHLLRLRAIRKLQENFLPLDAIQVELSRLPAEALRKIADGTELPSGTKHWQHRSEADAPTMRVLPHPPPRSTGWKRWELLPGLELHLREGADAQAREMAERLHALAEDHLRQKGTR